jgi:hypothetical protein
VNLYQLEREYEIVAEPVFSGDLLLLSTNKGLVVTAVTHAGSRRENAVRK